jgi:hypothetical protein
MKTLIYSTTFIVTLLVGIGSASMIGMFNVWTKRAVYHVAEKEYAAVVTNQQIAVNLTESSRTPSIIEQDNILKEWEKHLGCWAGSKGGLLEINSYEIHDLGSKEVRRYLIMPGESKNGQFLLKTDRRFKRSFLSKYIRFTVKSYDTIFVYTYDSYKDYLNHRFSGAGTFTKVILDNCVEKHPFVK